MGGRLRKCAAAFCALAALMVGCAKPEQARPVSDNAVRRYQLVDRAVSPVPGEPKFLDISIPTEYLDTRILPPPPEGETRALFVSVPSSNSPGRRHFCRMTYGSPNVAGALGREFPVDDALAPRFGLPDGFDCREGIHTLEGRPLEGRYITYYCEDPRLRAAGGQLQTWCHFESTVPTATCRLAVRIPSRAYLDCEYSPSEASHIRAMADDLSTSLERFVRRPSVHELPEGAPR